MALVANYVKRFVRLKKSDLEAAENVGELAYKILAHASDGLQNRNLNKRNREETQLLLLNFRYAIRIRI